MVDCPKDIAKCLAGEHPELCKCNGECSENGKEFTLPMHEMNNYACMPLDSVERLLKYCKLNRVEAQVSQDYLENLKEKSNALRQNEIENEAKEEACQEKRQVILGERNE